MLNVNNTVQMPHKFCCGLERSAKFAKNELIITSRCHSSWDLGSFHITICFSVFATKTVCSRINARMRIFFYEEIPMMSTEFHFFMPAHSFIFHLCVECETKNVQTEPQSLRLIKTVSCFCLTFSSKSSTSSRHVLDIQISSSQFFCSDVYEQLGLRLSIAEL